MRPGEFERGPAAAILPVPAPAQALQGGHDEGGQVFAALFLCRTSQTEAVVGHSAGCQVNGRIAAVLSRGPFAYIARLRQLKGIQL